MYEVEVTDGFRDWYEQLSEREQIAVGEAVAVLQAAGPGLGRPLVDSLRGSRHSNLKELRRGTVRILFAFDPRSVAILLIGGDKRGNWSTFYIEAIAAADELYDEHLLTLRFEGLLP